MQKKRQCRKSAAVVRGIGNVNSLTESAGALEEVEWPRRIYYRGEPRRSNRIIAVSSPEKGVLVAACAGLPGLMQLVKQGEKMVRVGEVWCYGSVATMKDNASLVRARLQLTGTRHTLHK
jgi:hypothetical protein